MLSTLTFAPGASLGRLFSVHHSGGQDHGWSGIESPPNRQLLSSGDGVAASMQPRRESIRQHRFHQSLDNQNWPDTVPQNLVFTCGLGFGPRLVQAIVMVLFLLTEHGDVERMPDGVMVEDLLPVGHLCHIKVQSCTITWSNACFGAQVQSVSNKVYAVQCPCP